VDQARSKPQEAVPLGVEPDVEAADVLEPDEGNAIGVAGAAERADLGDAVAVKDARGPLLAGMIGIREQALAIDDETGVQAAEAADAADHLSAHERQHLPKEALIAETSQHFLGRISHAVIGRDESGELGRRKGRLDALDAAAVKIGARTREAPP